MTSQSQIVDFCCEMWHYINMKTIFALIFFSQIAFAQRMPVMTNVRHDVAKEVSTLEWVGRYALSVYKQWWKDVADCTGFPSSAREDSVMFFFVNSIDFTPIPSDKRGAVVAITYGAQEQIYVSVGRVKDEKLIKHEMVHQHLRWWGEPDWDTHTNPAFKRCKVEMDES